MVAVVQLSRGKIFCKFQKSERDSIVCTSDLEPQKSHFGVTTLLTGIILLACCIGSSLIGFTYISMAIFLAYCAYCIVDDPGSLAKYLFLYFAVVSNIVGCYVVETTQLYLSELRMYSSFIGSLPLLIFARWIFLVVIIAIDKVLYRKEALVKTTTSDDKHSDLVLRAACIVVLLILVIGLACAMRRPPSSLMHLDRFQYANGLAIPQPFDRLIGLMSYLIYLPVCATRNSRTRQIGVACVALWVLYLIWTGEKFGGYFAVVVAFFIAYYDKLVPYALLYKRRLICIALVILASFVCVAVVIAGVQQSTTDYSSYFKNRLSQQGQLWWANYEKTGNQTHPEQLRIEIEGLNAPGKISDNVGERYGIYGVMYRVAPKDVVDAKLASGSRYAGAGYATIYYIWNSPGVIVFSIVMGLLVGGVLGLLVYGIKTKDIILILVSARLFVLSEVAISTGIFNDLFDDLSLLSYGYLILFSLWRLDARAKANVSRMARMPESAVPHTLAGSSQTEFAFREERTSRCKSLHCRKWRRSVSTGNLAMATIGRNYGFKSN